MLIGAAITLLVLSLVAFQIWGTQTAFWRRYHGPIFWTLVLFLCSLGALAYAVWFGSMLATLIGPMGYVVFVGLWLAGSILAVRRVVMPIFQAASP